MATDGGRARGRGGSWWILYPLGRKPGADLVFIPYVERTDASLAYFKGFAQRAPGIDRWLSALSNWRPIAAQSDVHTHAMICRRRWVDAGQMAVKASVRWRSSGCWPGSWSAGSRWTPALADGMSREQALGRCCVIGARCWRRNPLGDAFDQPLRAALTALMQAVGPPEPGSAAAALPA